MSKCPSKYPKTREIINKCNSLRYPPMVASLDDSYVDVNDFMRKEALAELDEMEAELNNAKIRMAEIEEFNCYLSDESGHRCSIATKAMNLEAENTDLRTRIQDGADLISGYQKDLDNARAENRRYRELIKNLYNGFYAAQNSKTIAPIFPYLVEAADLLTREALKESEK